MFKHLYVSKGLHCPSLRVEESTYHTCYEAEVELTCHSDNDEQDY